MADLLMKPRHALSSGASSPFPLPPLPPSSPPPYVPPPSLEEEQSDNDSFEDFLNDLDKTQNVHVSLVTSFVTPRQGRNSSTSIKEVNKIMEKLTHKGATHTDGGPP
jgi:hypothetical protein